MLVVKNMVEFIICDDDKKFLKRVEDLISKIMVKKKFEYDIVKFYPQDIVRSGLVKSFILACERAGL